MYDPTEITKLYLFGTRNPSESDYNQHIRPLGAIPPSITYDMNEYMTIGGGRYAYPSLFGIVRKFFTSMVVIPDGTYTYSQMESLAPLWTDEGITNGDSRIGISQYSTGIFAPDHVERSYIFGSSGFEINKNDVRFVIRDGVKTIENFEVRAQRDGFDFESGNPLSQLINDFINIPLLDPYMIGREEVSIEFTGSGKFYTTYTQENFQKDRAIESEVTLTTDSLIDNASGFPVLIAKAPSYFADLIIGSEFLSYRNDARKVIYGTPGNDSITAPELASLVEEYFIVGGEGNDSLSGGSRDDKLQGGDGNDTLEGGLRDDYLIGGDGNDILNGGLGNDQLDGGDGNDILNGDFGDNLFFGGKGDDIISGGSFFLGNYIGKDESFYQGNLADYALQFLSDGKVKITDKVSGRDGSDTLSSVKYAQFLNVKRDLTAGQDISFVVDTTGSMGDDLAAIKAQSLSIINAIFDDSGYLNSRVSVVGYNDPYTETFLSFTDQPRIEDRKQASIDAINRLYASGGGDFPESVNAGLIRALSGGAGQWRTDAIARRIILFGDAPPNDNELRAQVLALASNIGVATPAAPFAAMSIAGDVDTSSVSDGLALTRFRMVAAEADGSSFAYPVEIFTVLIGNDLTTRNDFSSLASATGGKTFTAANASEVVQALIAAIKTPPTDNLNNIITGDELDNILDGGAGNDTISGLGGNDTLIGGTGIDTMIGGTGNDTYFVDESGDVVTEDSTVATEIDTVKSTITYSLGANVENLTLISTAAINGIGNASDNIITGNSANNTLNGEDGNDTLDGDGGIDILVGGNGNDTYIVDTTTDTITETANKGIDTVKSSVTFSLTNLANVENLTLTGSAAINGIGNASDNIITGNSANNTLTGEDGNDTLDGDGGIDILVGGNGNDTYIVDTTTDTITEAVNQGTDTVKSSVTFSLTNLANVENLTLTGSAAINGTGNAGNNIITGNNNDNALNGEDGNDTLDGGAGNDILNGGLGKDILKGGIGDDIYILDDQGDSLVEEINQGVDTVRSSFSYTLGNNIENLILTGTVNDNGTGNFFDNTITGNSRNNQLKGEDGNDVLNGEGGNDELEGGNGNDVLNGGAGNDKLEGGDANDVFNGGVGNDKLEGGDGNDTYLFDLNSDQGNDAIRELASGGNDTIEFSGNEAVKIDLSLTNTQQINRNLGLKLEEVENVTGGDGNDTIFGNNLANTLKGGAGNDIIKANDGNDLIFGGLGNDKIYGGAGNDIIDAVAYMPMVLPVISLGDAIGKPGQGEIDTLTGGSGRDIFVLGTASNSKDGITGSSYYVGGKNADYALIEDFELNKNSTRSFIPGDTIQLYGQASYYLLGSTPTGSPQGVGIFTNDANQDLLGIIQGQGVTLSNLNLIDTSQFSFVN